MEYLNKKFGNKIKVINDDMIKFSYKDFYNKKTRNFVEKLYEEDIRLFGYNF